MAHNMLGFILQERVCKSTLTCSYNSGSFYCVCVELGLGMCGKYNRVRRQGSHIDLTNF